VWPHSPEPAGGGRYPPGHGLSLKILSGQALRSVAGLPFYNERANVISFLLFLPAKRAVLAISIHETAHADVHDNPERQKREHH
jgi:hypothetical protein